MGFRKKDYGYLKRPPPPLMPPLMREIAEGGRPFRKRPSPPPGRIIKEGQLPPKQIGLDNLPFSNESDDKETPFASALRVLILSTPFTLIVFLSSGLNKAFAFSVFSLGLAFYTFIRKVKQDKEEIRQETLKEYELQEQEREKELLLILKE